MAYIFETHASPEEVDAFVTEHEQNSLFQCSEWAEVKNNWDHYLTCVKDDGVIVASALVLVRRLPMKLSLFYIPRGPVMDYKNHELVSFMLDHLKELAGKEHAFAIRFDPNVFSRVYPYAEKDEPHAYENNDVIEYLKTLGARHRGFTVMIEEATQPRFNASMICTPDYYSHLDHKVRQSCTTALKKGAKIYEGHEYIHEFAQAMHYTETRKGVALRTEEYFRHMCDVYKDRCIVMVVKLNFAEEIERLKKEIEEADQQIEATPYKKQKNALEQKKKNALNDLARMEEDRKKEGRDEVILAGKLAIYNKNRMEFVYMGNNADYMRLRSSYLLYKTYLDICVEKGIRYVSMGGIEGTLDDGLTTFKSSWLMNIEEYIGEFNIVLNPAVYTAFDKVYPWVLKMAAQIRSGKKESIH